MTTDVKSSWLAVLNSPHPNPSPKLGRGAIGDLVAFFMTGGEQPVMAPAVKNSGVGRVKANPQPGPKSLTGAGKGP